MTMTVTNLHKPVIIACFTLLVQLITIVRSQVIAFDLTADDLPPRPFKVEPPPDPPTAQVPDWLSSPNRDKHAEFLADVMYTILYFGVFHNEDRRRGPYDFILPEELPELIDMKVGEEPASHEQLIQIIRLTIRYSPHPSHYLMLDKRVAGLDPYALVGDWLAATMSNLVVTYQVAPIWTLMEFELAKQIGALMGWPNPEGVSTSGAGAANSMALALALQEKWPKLKEVGLAATGISNPVIFVSADASYAWDKAGLYSGFATSWIEKIRTHPLTGRMRMEVLLGRVAHRKAQGDTLLMIVATAGTPLLGAIDDVDLIAEICEREKMWLHIDAEKGGFAVLAPGTTLTPKTLSRADSVTFGTWMLATPYVSTFLVTKSNTKLQSSFGLHAPYVFTGLDLYNGSYDAGDHTIQTSRRPEVAKLWTLWKAKGLDVMRQHVLKTYANKRIFLDTARKVFPNEIELVQDFFDLPQVAFYYIPYRLRSRRFEDRHKPEFKLAQSAASLHIKTQLMRSNHVKLSIGDKGDGVSRYMIVSLTNSVINTNQELLYILQAIVAEGYIYDGRKYPFNYELPPLSAPDPWVNVPIQSMHEKFFQDTFQLFLKKGIFFLRRDVPSKFRQPEELLQLVDLKLKATGTGHSDLLRIFEKIIDYSPHWGHPYFIYQLAAGLDPYTLAADYVASAMNTPMITYEDSPVFTHMQNDVLAAFRQQIFGTRDGDGVFTDGGSMANQMAIALGRHAKAPRVRVQGYQGRKFVLYISEDGHYSTQKGAILQSLGGDNTIKIVADSRARMNVAKLEDAILASLAANDIPFMIVITTGTTIFGGIDDVEKIVDLCTKYALWCHVDGMFGGLVAMSEFYRYRLAGIERCDSFGVDLHKLMGSTMVMSALITRKPGIFKDTFGVNSPIDFSPYDGNYTRDYDLGDNHWQVDKRNNLFKFWFLWKAKGRKGMGSHVDRILTNTEYLTNELHRREGFQPMLAFFEVTNVCFFYLPLSMRKMSQSTPEFREQIGMVSFKIEIALIKDGVMNVVAQNRHSELGDTPVFIKFVMMGSSLTRSDIDHLLNAVDYYGKDIQFMDDRAESRRFHTMVAQEDRRFEPFGNAPRSWKNVSLFLSLGLG